MKLRTMAVIALALVAGGAQAQDAGWDTKAGLLFGLGVDGTPLGSYDGSVGLQYNLGPQSAVRLGLNLGRTSHGRTEFTNNANITTTTVADDVAPIIDDNGTPSDPTDDVVVMGFSSQTLVNLQAEYLMRFATSAVSPYAGAGVSIGFDMRSKTGKDENSANTIITEWNNKYSAISFGLLGKAGLEWRLNKVVALTAEYQLGINLVSLVKFSEETKTTGQPTDSSDGKRTDVFGVGTGVTNGGQIGLIAFF